MSVDYLLLDSYLQSLKLHSFLQHYHAFIEDATKNQAPYHRLLLALAQQEVADREHQKQQQRIRAAKFPYIKDLSQFNYAKLNNFPFTRIFELARGEYLTQAENIILLGNPGLGKTHIALGLALDACRQLHRVRFYNAATLVNELIAAQKAQTLDKFLAIALRHKLLVIDELGFIPFSPLGAQLMFQFFSTLYERVSIILTTNLKFADWSQVFGDEKLTLALLDRLTHKAHIIEFVGESYRFRERLDRIAQSEFDLPQAQARDSPNPVAGPTAE